jgi:hypothetical protein
MILKGKQPMSFGKLTITVNLTAEEEEDLREQLVHRAPILGNFHFGGLELRANEVSDNEVMKGVRNITIDAIAVVKEGERRTHSTPVITPVTP